MTHNRIQAETVKIAESGGAKARRFVTAAGDYAAAIGGAVIGITRNDAAENSYAPVDVMGRLEVEASAAIAKGAAVQTTADGKAATRTGANYIAGYAIEAAAADGDIIEILRGI